LGNCRIAWRRKCTVVGSSIHAIHAFPRPFPFENAAAESGAARTRLTGVEENKYKYKTNTNMSESSNNQVS